MTFDQIITKTAIQPRSYQRNIVNKVVDMFCGRHINMAGELENAVRSVIIESPTGSGKTVMGLIIASIMQSTTPDLTVGWVAMRRNLLKQAHNAAIDFGFNLRNFEFVSMFDKYPERLVEARKEGRPTLIIIDEGHHTATDSMAHILNMVRPQLVMGLTATPFRSDNATLCFEKCVRDAGIHQLIQEGYLSKFDQYTIPKWDIDTVVEFYTAAPKKWGRSVFYFLSLAECYKFRNKLLQQGYFPQYRDAVARNDHHDMAKYDPVITGSSNRDAQLETYLSGETNLIINCMVLTEGFDDPTMETVWVRDSSKGPTMQMAGRVFRPHHSIQYKKVVQSVNTNYPIMRCAAPRTQYRWHQTGESGEWRSVQPNAMTDEISSAAMRAIAKIDVVLPELRDRARSMTLKRD